jgi:hypothetical protein
MFSGTDIVKRIIFKNTLLAVIQEGLKNCEDNRNPYPWRDQIP